MKELWFAIKNTVPIFFTYLFIEIAFGILMIEAGYGVFLSTLSAIIIFAGSMQIVMVPLITSGASLFTIALMTFFINARHIFYGIGFIDTFRKMGWRYPYMVFSLTDETYSVLCSVKYEKDIDENKAVFFIALVNHLYWILGCFLGACAGQFLQFDMQGIEFSATAFFLVVVTNQWQQYSSKIPFLTAIICAFIFYIFFGPDYFIIPTLILCMVLLLVLRKFIEEKENKHNE